MSARPRAVTALLLVLTACGPERPGHPVADPALTRTARDVVALIGGYNCEMLPSFLPDGAPAFLGANIGTELMDGMQDPVERVCFVLGVVQDYPYSETMDVRATRVTAQRAELLLLGDGDRAELVLVNEGRGWKLDPMWALKQVQDLAVHQTLRWFAITQDEFFYGNDRFTDSSPQLAEATHSVVEFYPGIATAGLPPMYVYAALGPDAGSVCGSSLSLSGELFMIRAAADGSASYARGTLPATCPGSPLRGSW